MTQSPSGSRHPRRTPRTRSQPEAAGRPDRRAPVGAQPLGARLAYGARTLVVGTCQSAWLERQNSGQDTTCSENDRQRESAPVVWHTSLRDRRLAAGLSQAQLADHAVLARATVDQYESGRARAGLAVMHLIDMVLSTPGLSFADRHVWHATLRERYRGAGFSRASLARALRVNAKWIAEYENGGRDIGLYSMRLIDGVIATGQQCVG
jgi:transcriptional regulator with XRE-family HTH domain